MDLDRDSKTSGSVRPSSGYVKPGSVELLEGQLQGAGGVGTPGSVPLARYESRERSLLADYDANA